MQIANIVTDIIPKVRNKQSSISFWKILKLVFLRGELTRNQLTINTENVNLRLYFNTLSKAMLLALQTIKESKVVKQQKHCALLILTHGYYNLSSVNVVPK